MFIFVSKTIYMKRDDMTNMYSFVLFSFFQESGLEWPILRRWEVPWQWQTVTLTSLACGFGCVLIIYHDFISNIK